MEAMLTTVNLPYSLYKSSEALAASRGATVEQVIIEAVAKEVRGAFGFEREGWGNREVALPVIPSKEPGALDLARFDFDDLIA